VDAVKTDLESPCGSTTGGVDLCFEGRVCDNHYQPSRILAMMARTDKLEKAAAKMGDIVATPVAARAAAEHAERVAEFQSRPAPQEYNTPTTPPPPLVFEYTPPDIEGAKHTNPKDVIGSGKVPLELVPDTMRIAAAMAFLEGAAKYGRYNWRVAGVRASIYKSALDRHLAAWWNGEDMDPDSGLPHLWKALSCLAVLIDAEEADKLTDDRPPRLDVASMLAEYTPRVNEIKERYAHLTPHQYTIADGE
jgi:hypothetical protein